MSSTELAAEAEARGIRAKTLRNAKASIGTVAVKECDTWYTVLSNH